MFNQTHESFAAGGQVVDSGLIQHAHLLLHATSWKEHTLQLLSRNPEHIKTSIPGFKKLFFPIHPILMEIKLNITLSLTHPPTTRRLCSPE